jgi:valyl-tRNA synthetase
MKKEIPKAYNPKEVEDKIYKTWEKSGFFNPDNLELPENAGKFSIAMPPPNVTGVLHLGHALENTLMDTMIRYQRMCGKKALLLPGTDHAAVATQAKVEKDLIESGKYKNPREELGKEKLLEIIREYSEKSKVTILSQIRKMGTSCDWDRLAYTFDEKRSKAVNEVFIKMRKDRLIYRGYRVVNWSVKGQSTCSDDELVYIERPAKLYTFKYSKSFPIPIATTRPETKFGDTAVAVHPKGKWKKYIGRTFEIKNFADSVNLKIKVIANKKVDEEFGTGAVGVTPAHSMIDFEMYEKEGNIAFVQVIDKNGKMTENAGARYQNLTVENARKNIINYLKKEKLLEKEKDIVQNVSTSDRFGDVVEILPMSQWFVNVNKKIPGKNKSLKDLMQEAVTIGHSGDIKQKIKITPDRFERIYLDWINNLRDWCISRQVWWGHQIPVWYDLTVDEYKKYKNNPKLFGDFLNYTQPAKIMVGCKNPKADGNWLQDPDTLDTWFSSGLWTFSILGWPDETEDLENFHPTSWMQMGSELVFFWMARMILMSTYTIDQIPFKDVYIHGILRDKDGRKFSKSLGNGIDPLELIKKYGTDALRLSLIIGNTPGNDARFYEEKVEGYRNFVNKLWNISRYILMSVEKIPHQASPKRGGIPVAKTLADKWILGELNNLIKEVTNDLENYNFSAAGEKLREFTWNDFADWYLEISKVEKNKDELLIYILKDLLKLWHPFIPFVTEEIWKKFNNTNLIIENYPDSKKYNNKWVKFSEEGVAEKFKTIQNIIIAIRNARAKYKIEPVKKIDASI